MSAQQLITDHLDIWTAAHKTRSIAGRGSNNKLNLHGIRKLRELILSLAMSGKLVPQDQTDISPLETYKVVRDKFVEKYQKIEFPDFLNSEAIPFTVPNSWIFLRLGQLVEVLDNLRKPVTKSARSEGIYPYYGASGIVDYIADYIFDEPLVLIGEDGAKWDSGDQTAFLIQGKTWVNNHAHVVRPIRDLILDQYLVYSLVQRDLNEFITGMTVPKLNQARLNSIPIALPPLAEQHRIVAKVDELMAFCDQLEQTQSDNIAAHAQLVEALLTTLINSRDHKELQTNWQRIAAHFDTLFTTGHSIDQLKQTILQLAVMGKLVPQNPNDEPASELLKKIAAEKAQLIKSGDIKKQKDLESISDKEKPFDIPNGWTYCRLDDICTGITSGSTPPQQEFLDVAGIPYLKVYNIKDQKIDFEYKPQFVSDECSSLKLKRSILYPGDVVMNIVGPPLGKIAIIPDTYPEWNCNQAITFFRPLIKELNLYIYTYLTAGIFLKDIELIGTAGQDNISVTKSRSIVLPMPPLEEQHRIVAKVDELMSLCDTLKTNLQNAQTTQLALADALVEQAVL